MREQNNGGPAFPVPVELCQDLSIAEQRGMTLRDYFAARATKEDIDSFMYKQVKDQQPFMPAFYAVMSREEAKYAYADAMLKARG